MLKNPLANVGDVRDAGLILGSGRSPGGRHGNPSQYSCLENPRDRGAWQAAAQEALVLKNPLANVGDVRDVGSTLGLGRSPGGGHGNPSQYSCLENPMDRGAWRATVHRAAKSQA